MSLTRRNFLRSSAAATSGLTLLGGAAGATAQSWLPALLPASDPQSPPRSHAYPFQHGVASGDPLTDGVMLWTRISPPPDWQGPLAYRWHLALDPLCQWLVATGEGSTDASRDFTVKEDVRGLSAGQTYYYLFEALGQISDTGCPRTLPKAGWNICGWLIPPAPTTPAGILMCTATSPPAPTSMRCCIWGITCTKTPTMSVRW